MGRQPQRDLEMCLRRRISRVWWTYTVGDDGDFEYELSPFLVLRLDPLPHVLAFWVMIVYLLDV